MNALKKRNKAIAQFQLALGMAGLATNHQSVDLILEVQKAVSKMGGKFTLRDACRISAEVEERHTIVDRKEEGKRLFDIAYHKFLAEKTWQSARTKLMKEFHITRKI